MLDTDTVCVQNLDEIFEEAKTGLILYATHHGYKQKIRQQMLQNYQKMYGIERKNLVHYGGEFLAGSKAVLSELLDDCSKAITKARETQGLHPWADEKYFPLQWQSSGIKRFIRPMHIFTGSGPMSFIW